MKTLKLTKIFLFMLLLAACTGEEEEAFEESFETEVESSGQVRNGQCFSDKYAPSEDDISRELDILIVIDTSGSIKDERSDIAKGFNYFLDTLPAEVDYRIGVMLAHSPNKKKWVGELYQRNNEPFVLDSNIHTIDEIKAHLDRKMKNPTSDGYSDGGEMGLLSLQYAFENNVEKIRGQGLLRENAALAVIFIADEQDICAEYPAGVTPVPDPNGGEDRSFNKYCKNDDGSLKYTPKTVLNAIKSVHGSDPIKDPLVVGGVIYNNANTVPAENENEIGYGYLETVELAGGITIDMANGDYGPGLERLGRLAKSAGEPDYFFNLSTGKLDINSIEAFVNNSPVPFDYLAETNQVQLTETRDNFSVVKLNYCEKDELPLESKKVIAGGFHSCALLVEGNVKCWGANNFGQLGQGNTDDLGDDETLASIPVINFGKKVKDLSAGLNHTCAVFEDNKVKCWGDNGRGQLGQGNTEAIGDDEAISTIAELDFGEEVRKIYSGTRYNCVLLKSNNIKCWGENNFGQLGYGNTDNIGDDEDLSSLAYVSVGDQVTQMDISTISSHACASLKNGGMKCWGLNSKGQLGYGHTNNLGDDELPSDVPKLDFGSDILQLATGLLHTCALVEGQKVRCWGSNINGQIGTGNSETIGDDESATSIGTLTLDSSEQLMVATGNNHTCTVASNNKVHCWGLGVVGATGLGHTDKIGDDEQLVGNTLVELPKEITQVAGGLNHTCALTKDDGKIICWGQNTRGQLGLGHEDNIGDNESPADEVQLKESSSGDDPA